MTKVLSAIAAVLMVGMAGLTSPSRAYADPVTITSGVFKWSLSGEGTPVSLRGTDGAHSFSFEGQAFDMSLGGIGQDNVFNINLFAVGQDLKGQVTYGGQTYGVNTEFPEGLFGITLIQLQGSRTFDMFDPFAVATLIVPFHMGDESRFSPPFLGSWLPGGRLTGSGLAYVKFDAGPQSAEFRFGATVPEPATALLFATGGFVLALRRRAANPREERPLSSYEPSAASATFPPRGNPR